MKVIKEKQPGFLSAIYEAKIFHLGDCIVQKVWHEQKPTWQIVSMENGYVEYYNTLREIRGREKI
jgi:hypothetical protein